MGEKMEKIIIKINFNYLNAVAKHSDRSDLTHMS